MSRLQKVSMGIKSLEDVVKADLCTGCGICEMIGGHDSVRMQIDHKGYLRPVVTRVNLEDWFEIERVCPGITVQQDKNIQASALERLWGPVQSSYTGYSTDDEIRWRGSSGGVISAILIYLLESGQTDYVVHVGISDSDPFDASVSVSRTRQEVIRNAGSLYMPTAPLVSLRNFLEREDLKFAFVGKPCDVAALKAYLKIHPEYNERITVTISFFCAGVPSKSATYEIVSELGVKINNVTHFHYRGHGWPGRATAVDVFGQEHSMSYADSWGNILCKRLQFRCKICPDGVGEFADVVCGDAWQSKDGYPDFDERPGHSLILARTTNGKQILEKAESTGYIRTEVFYLERLGEIQPYQKARRQAIVPRLLALRLLRKPIPRFTGFYLVRNAVDAGLWRFVRGVLGMFRRVMFKTYRYL
jgi:coenzyme F420 hydrogenase subunit beta